jgi:ferredoxin-NADP reductase
VNLSILSNEPETPTTRRLRLALDGRRFSYLAGQAAALAVDAGEPTPYSFASAPSDTQRDGALEFLVKVDGASRFGARVATLEPDSRVRVTGPVGVFTLSEVSPRSPLLFVAGGTGIAPLRSMIREALHGPRGGRIALVYSARTPDEFAYIHELRERAAGGDLELTQTLTGDATDWDHARGRAGTEHLRDLVTSGTVAFLCGPKAMVGDVAQALRQLGVSAAAIRAEDW